MPDKYTVRYIMDEVDINICFTIDGRPAEEVLHEICEKYLLRPNDSETRRDLKAELDRALSKIVATAEVEIGGVNDGRDY